MNVTYYFGGFDIHDGDLFGFFDEVNFLLSLDNPPLVLTTSYGMSEGSLTLDLVEYVEQIAPPLPPGGI